MDSTDPTAPLVHLREPARANLLADIVGHPQGAPTIEELAYTNPDLDEPTIRDELSVMVEADILRTVRGCLDGQPLDCYLLTTAARETFDHERVLPVETWRRVYTAVEKPDRIQWLEQLPRRG